MPSFGSTSINIDSILSQISSNESISDIHVSTDEFLAFRVNGEIVKYDKLEKFTEEVMETLMKQMLKGNPTAFEKFIGEREADFSFIGSDSTPYRVNAFFKVGKMAFVMRKISSTARKIEDILIPPVAESLKNNILSKNQGLFLVTGPTGAGKSTSIVAMLEYINHLSPKNIITIEDPIEYFFKSNKCLISQRQVGIDTLSFPNALKACMREDPDIIFVGEIRDKITAEAVLNLAETGHFVFSTLHTPSAAGTVNRFISFFDPEIQTTVAERLAESLVGIQSQALVKSLDKKSRVGMFELLINNTATKNNIKQMQIAQIDSIIETSTAKGMITMAQYATVLLQNNIVSEDDVAWVFNKKTT